MAETRPDTVSQLKTVRIVLVDDHEIVRRGVASLIAAQPGMEVCGEADGVTTALEVIARTTPTLALIDMSLRDGDGLELIRAVTAQHPQVLTLALSMHDEMVYAERALRAGAKGYVRKVDVAETIMGAIERVVGGEVYVSPAAASELLKRLSFGKRDGGKKGVEGLSDRELQVLRCIGRGLSNREVAEELYISVKTVESHREHIKLKLNLPSNSDLLRYAIEFCKV